MSTAGPYGTTYPALPISARSTGTSPRSQPMPARMLSGIPEARRWHPTRYGTEDKPVCPAHRNLAASGRDVTRFCALSQPTG